MQMRAAAAAAAAVAVAAAAAARAAFLRSKWCVTRTVEPAGRLAAQLWISEDGRPVAALSSLRVLMGNICDVGVAAGGDADVGGLVVATTLPSSRRERLNPGSYEAAPEICSGGEMLSGPGSQCQLSILFALFDCLHGGKWPLRQNVRTRAPA